MQATRNRVFGTIAIILLAGCGSLTEREVDYQAGAVKAPPLEVPPSLTVPETEQRYTIPGSDGEKVASYSEYNKQKTEQPCVAPAATPPAAPVAQAAASSAPVPTAKLQENKSGKKILLNEPFDRSWRRVGLALDGARIEVTDKDRSKGTYFVAAVPDKNKKKKLDYQVVVREIRKNSEVSVVTQRGKSDAEAARLLDLIYQNLEKEGSGASR